MTHIKQRRDTAANWTSADPVLLLGEVGWETDTLFAKLGDGVTAWSDLPYAIQPGPVTSVNGDTGDVVLNKSDIGLANVDNTNDMGKPLSVAQQAYVDALDSELSGVLDTKADLDSPEFTGDPKAPTPATADSDTSVATTAFVKAAIAAMVRPVGSVRANSTQNLPDTASTDIVFAAVTDAILKGDMEATGSGLTVPVAGVYAVSASIAVNNSGTTGIMHVAITVNGTNVRVIERSNFSNSAPTVKSGDCFLTLAADDVIGLRCFQSNGSDRPLWDPTSVYRTALRAVLISS